MLTQKTTKGASSQRGVRRRTNGAPIGGQSGRHNSGSKSAHGTDWRKLSNKSARAIRKGISADHDARPTNDAFWKSAKVVMPEPKEIVTMRLDADLLRWLRRRPGYQTRINAILRAYMQANRD
jgi:uncharacterized protein (DUF4415 family)